MYSTENSTQYPAYFENIFQGTFDTDKIPPQANSVKHDQKSASGELEAETRLRATCLRTSS